ncbi:MULTISPECIES: hypothetical protein [Flavobacteriaceae]|uniref:Uncharacterized protein n=1 Tax=Flagellimonas sediminis TaxID=2696468 RepID=A0A6I5KVH5_9FLAO|nr:MULTISPECIES: hypothetical protein [Allomuricauda]NDV44984.1 hypothetical protein [Allomuricauda sediminis]
MENKVDKKYIREFNLGYEMAKELKLERPMLQGQDISQAPPDNPVHAGMFQYFKEVALSKSKDLGKSIDSRSNPLKEEGKEKDKNKGKGLSL